MLGGSIHSLRRFASSSFLFLFPVSSIGGREQTKEAPEDEAELDPLMHEEMRECKMTLREINYHRLRIESVKLRTRTEHAGGSK